MGEINYTCITGARTTREHPSKNGLKLLLPLQMVDDKFTPFEIKQTAWKPDTECVMFYLHQGHDGTLLFTYEAIITLSQAAKEYIDANPEYGMSFFGVDTEYKEQLRQRSGAVWPGQIEQFILVLQKAEQDNAEEMRT